MSTPAAIRVAADRRGLRLVAADGREEFFSAEYLRVFSPSAEVRGHGDAERKIVGGKRAVAIARIEPVGAYAIRIVFDDGHDTGLYSWNYLADLSLNRDRYWTDYLAALASRGLGRD